MNIPNNVQQTSHHMLIVVWAMLLLSLMTACVTQKPVAEQAIVEIMPEEAAGQVATDAAIAVAGEEAAETVMAEPVQAEQGAVTEQVGSSAVVEPPRSMYKQEDVIWIQERLQELGYYNGAIDGSAGRATRGAIEAYQADQGLEPDGKPNAELREFMWRNGG